jgi:hypothetical protein
MKLCLPRLLVLVLFFPFFVRAQYNSYTIDYSTLSSLPNNNQCNIFAAPAKVSNYLHTSAVGFPRYLTYTVGQTTYKVLSLDCGYTQSGLYNGTAVNIQFPWKPYHLYTVTAYANGDPSKDGTSSTSNLYLWMGVNNGGYSSNPSTDCSFMQNFTVPQFYAHNQFNPSSGAYNPYQLVFTCPAQLQTFLVAGYGWEGYGSIYLQKIVIQETKDFTLSPATATVTCGSNAPINFSVVSPTSVTASSYVWKLGATNTWLYNGSAAPATITTTTPNITLTPVAGTTAPTNVSVDVYANGGLYNTATSVAKYDNGIPANLAITGAASIQTINPSTSSYSVSNLPAGASVTWSATPSTGMVNLTTAGNTANVSPLYNVRGTVTLTATVTAACGTTATYTFPITLLNACDLITTPVSLSSTYNADGSVTLSWNNQPGITGYNIQYTMNGLSGGITTGTTTTNSYTYYGQANSTQRFAVSAYCNSGQQSYWSQWDTFVVKQPCARAVVSNVSSTGNQVIVTMTPQSGISTYNFKFTSQGVTTLVQSVPLTNNQYIFTGDYNTTYSVSGQCVCPAGSGGNSSWTTPVNVTTGPSGSCTPPTFGTIMVSSNNLYIFWVASSDASTYNFQFTNTATGATTVVSNITKPANGGPYIYTAQHNVTYNVAIQSNCMAGGQSSWSVYNSSVTTTKKDEGTRSGAATLLNMDSTYQPEPQLYPVPASGQVTLQVPANQDGSIDIQVLSMSGSVVHAKRIAASKGLNTIVLNVSDLSSGIYMVKIIQGKGSMFVRKMVIQK